MKTNQHISSMPENMANTGAFAVSSVSDEKVALFNRVSLKTFSCLSAGDRKGVAPKSW